jgi:hypothetical protein
MVVLVLVVEAAVKEQSLLRARSVQPACTACRI